MEMAAAAKPRISRYFCEFFHSPFFFFFSELATAALVGVDDDFEI